MLKILSVRHIDGPNIYIYKPVLIARIDLLEHAERESYEYAGFSDRLLRALPGLREHHCAKGEPGGFVERLYEGTYFGHIVEHVAIELACLAGLDVHYGKTVYAGNVGQYDMVMECKSYPLQTGLLNLAVHIVGCFATGQSFDILPLLDDVISQHREYQLGPSTQAIADAAAVRGIPVRRLTDGSLLQLGHGEHRKLVSATITSQTSAVGVDIACDKALTKAMLEQAGIAVPEGGVASSLEEALALYRWMRKPVVLKPWNGNQGRGVSLNIRSEEDVEQAYAIASGFSDRVIVEEHVEGSHLRLLVVGHRLVAASLRLPARVQGDGVRTVAELIDWTNLNPDRGVGHEKPLTRLTVDEVVHATLQKQGMSLHHVPAPGQTVLLRESANLSTGGEAMDITASIHDSYKRLAERISRIIPLDVCGIDMVASDFESPYHPAHARVIEVNAAPGIRMHEKPSHGEAQPAAREIVETLFPGTQTGRIPIVSVTGTNGKTTTTRLIGHSLSVTGQVVGMTTTGGVFLDGRLVVEGDTTGPDSARMVLSDPSVQVAVLETARGGIVRGGLAYDKAHVAVLTNITLDHVGQDGIETIEDLLHVKSLVAECVAEDGTVVLNADDPELVRLAKRLKARVVFFSLREDNKVLMRHLAEGGFGYYVSHGWIVEARGQLTWDVVAIDDVPLTQGGSATFHVANCMAAVAALRAMGVTRQLVGKGLASFDPVRNNRGRTMMFSLPNDVRVVLDYGHNPDGFEKVGQWLQHAPHQRLIGVVGVPGDRADHVARTASERLAEFFDALVVKEDKDKRGRAPGEVAALMANHLASVAPQKPLMIQLDETTALTQAIQLAAPGDIVCMFYEKLDPLVHLVERYGGLPIADLRKASAHGLTAVLS